MAARRLAAALLLLLVASCAFYANAPLFSDREAAVPFADGARFLWREGDADETKTVIYRRRGAGYEIRPVDEPAEQALRVIFIPLAETEEEDYIAQIAIEADEEGRLYAFLWRTPEGFRIIGAPGAFRDSALGLSVIANECPAAPNSECRFVTRENAVNFYREAVYRAFVIGSETPADYMDQVPLAGPSASRPGKS